MQKKRRKQADALDDVEDVASATECTGLAPALPQDEAEREACAELYAIHEAKTRGDARA